MPMAFQLLFVIWWSRVTHPSYRRLENNLEITQKEADQIILHWLAELYVYTHYEKGLSFREMMKMVSPEWLYTHFSPLHETSLKNAWEKAVYICGK